MSENGVNVRLLFVDGGSYHHEEVVIPGAALADHERLIDCLREDPAVQGQLYLDVERLCAAWIVG